MHTGSHGIHVGCVCIVSLVSWLLLLFDATWVVSMHDLRIQKMPRSPRILLATTRWTGGEQNCKGISMKWFSWLSLCQWQATLYNADVVRFCFWSFSGLPVCCKFPRGCRCYVLYCQSLYIVVGDPDQKWHEVTSLMFLLGRNQLKLPYLGSQQIHLFCQGTNGVKKE